MSDLEKVKTLLALLSTTELRFKGAREAFLFTVSYQWLLELAKTMEKEQVDADR